MYAAGKALLLRVLKVPPEPHAPHGSAASTRVFRAAPAYFRYKLLGWAIAQAWLVILAIAGFVALEGALREVDMPRWLRSLLMVLEAWGWLVLAAGVFVSYLTVRLDFEMRWYIVTDRSLRIREGVWQVHEMTMTFANIQNISVSQGPLQRLFGIADLRVQSAGGGGMGQAEGGHGQAGMRDLHVGFFKGVGDAPAIRDLVLERLRLLKDAGLGDHDDARAAQARTDRGPTARPVARLDALLPVLRSLRDETALLRRAAGG